MYLIALKTMSQICMFVYARDWFLSKKFGQTWSTPGANPTILCYNASAVKKLQRHE
jgi:hypothetical protein